MNPLAHGIGNVQDLPIPAWMFYWGAGLVLVVSFVLLGALWKQPLLAAHERGRDLGAALSRGGGTRSPPRVRARAREREWWAFGTRGSGSLVDDAAVQPTRHGVQ